jgi:hypothetical protein
VADNFDIKDFTLSAACTVRATDTGGVKTPWHIVGGGDTAAASADANNPIKIGYKAKATLSTFTPYAADNRANAHADLDGALITRENHTLGDLVNGHATDTAGTLTACIASSGTGVKTYLTDITVCNSSAVDIMVDIKDGSTTRWTIPAPAGSGATHRFASPLPGTAATAWQFQGSAAATTLTVSMAGFKSKV